MATPAAATATKAKKGARPSSKKDAVFVWEGLDKKGNKTKGELSGQSQNLIKAQLRKQGVKVTKVRKKPQPLFGGGKKSIKPMDIAIFTRQLATMMKAGVPLVQAFDIVGEGLENPSMAELVAEIKNEVAGGTSFASALSRHPKYFDDLFVSLIDSGEQSGALETMLDRVATYKEKSEALKAKIKKAMKYPIAVVCVAIIVTGILLVKVVPQFAQTFANFGSELPAFTLFVLQISDFAIAWWFHTLIGIIAAVFLFKELKTRSQAFADGLDRFSLKAPIVGNIVKMAVVARFSRTLATTFSAGVPLVDGLDSVAGATGNVVYSDAIKKIKEEVTSGIQLNFAIRNTGIFPSMLIQMVSIGEESGALDDMLAKVATHYEEEVDNAVDGLTSLMEPIIMSVLGILIGGLMIAMYLPIFQLGDVL